MKQNPQNNDYKPDRSVDDSNATPRILKCEDIQPLLTEYLAHELGEARSVLIREHLNRCPKCRSAAADLQNMFELLRSASRDEAAALPSQLSERRRRRIRWALVHPFLDWIYAHHILVSLVAGVLAILLVLAFVRRAPITEANEIEQGIPVNIDGGPPGTRTNVVPIPPEAL